MRREEEEEEEEDEEVVEAGVAGVAGLDLSFLAEGVELLAVLPAFTQGWFMICSSDGLSRGLKASIHWIRARASECAKGRIDD